MAFNFHDGAYYGDTSPQYLYKSNHSGPSSNPGSQGGGSTPSPSSGTPTNIDSLDFSRIKVSNAPWVQKKTLEQMVADLTASPKTLTQTIALLDDLIARMKQCATAASSAGV